MKSALYYECHITIDPPIGETNFQQFGQICGVEGFRVAKLLMRKENGSAGVVSHDDSFCTTRGVLYEDVVCRMNNLICRLKDFGFNVRRYKIEDTLLDSNRGDELGLLLGR